jgi:hypothetical protein
MNKRFSISALTVLICLFLAHAENPKQFTIVDNDTYVHTGWYKFWKFPWQPDNWKSPVDYYSGYTYHRVEVLSFDKPDVSKVMLQHCYFQDKHATENHACGHKPTWTKPEVIRHQNSSLWQAGKIDWSRKLLDFMYIDNACGTSAKGCKAGAHVNVTIIVVAANERLVAPANWDCPGDWNCASESGVEAKTVFADKSRAQSTLQLKVNRNAIGIENIPSGAKLSLAITDTRGRHIAEMPVQAHSNAWQGTIPAASLAGSGTYIIAVKSGLATLAGDIVAVP